MVTRLRLATVCLLIAGCGNGLQLNLVINDPCNQPVLSDARLPIEHIELEVRSSDLDGPQGTVWRRDDRQGEFPSLEPASAATVSIYGRESNGTGNPADILAAMSVGEVDLSGELDEEVVDLNLVFGKVDTFVNTTDAAAATAGVARCSALAAQRRGHTASPLPNGTVLVAGGERVNDNSVTYWETTEIYDPVTGLYRQSAAMRWVRKAHTATVLQDGRILIAGGIGLNGETVDTWKVALVYDPQQETFQEVPMMEQRAHHTATLLSDGRVLLAGGAHGPRELQTTEVFDPTTATTCVGPNLNQARANHGAVRIGNQGVAVVGGRGSGQVLGRVELVSVSGCGGNTTALTPELSVPRSHPSVGLFAGTNAILVAGGFSNVATAAENGIGVDQIEMVVVDSQTPAASTICTPNEQLHEARGAAAMAPLPTGFLIAGGVSAVSQVIASAERVRLIDVGACDVSVDLTLGALSSARGGAQATAMVGGDVLITGGFGRSGGSVVSLAQGELYVRRR